MFRGGRLVCVLGVLVSALATFAHGAQVDRNNDAFKPVPGVREPSGRLIVRISEPAAFIAQGMTEAQAAERVRDAEARLAPHRVTHFADVDEHIIRVPGNQTEEQFARRLLATGFYEYVESDWLVAPAGVEPNDQYYIDQWYLPHIGADWAWLYTKGDASVVVAIVDTGVDGTHPELAQAMVPGYNAVDELAELDGGQVSDIVGHGTRVAGIAAAAGNNGIGVCGVGWSLSIMPVRASNSTSGLAHISDLNAGARWAVEHGAMIANVSYNGVNNNTIQTTGEYIRSIGGLLIWAVGNGPFHIEGYDHDHVIIVGATDVFDQFATFSNYGELVDVVAPGTPIRTTRNGGGYIYVGGTSYAAPIVAGIAALMWTASPNASPTEIEQAIFATVTDLGDPGEDDYFGFGLVNAFEAVKMARPCPADMVSSSTAQPPADGDVDGADLAFLLSQWGAASPNLADIADRDTFSFPADGAVDGADLARLLSMWDDCP